VLSLANIALFSVLMHFYLKSQRGGKIVDKPKFWILTTGIALFVIEFFINFFGDSSIP
jgi:hypothetical protein